MNFLTKEPVSGRGKLVLWWLVWCSILPISQTWATSKSIPTSKGRALFAARINIQGTVKNEKGEPLPGVSIKLKSSKTTTTTDQNGVFRLNLPTGNEVLIFSYVGYKSKEIALGGQRSIEVVLQEDNSALDEVVVVGYGTQKKAHLTGAVETITMKDIEDLPVSNVGAGLAGRVLGVGVSGGTARPGVPATLRLRNPVSISKDGGNDQPLYVIDGIIQVTSQGMPDNTLFNSLTSAEIESISFLKDAAAAIYGSRAANGVVLVTTKKGTKGAPRINYSGSYAINDEVYRTKMMNAYDFAMYMNIMNGPNGANQQREEDYFFSDDELAHFRTIDHDWLDPAWSSAYNTQHSINVSGGSDRATYFSNVTYFKQDGNLGTLNYDRWNFRAGSDVQVSNNFKVGLQVSGNYVNNVKTWNKVAGENDNNDYKTLLTIPRYIPMYVDGYPVKVPGTNNDLSQYHFYEIQRLNNLNTGITKGMTVNVNAEYQLPYVEGLAARLNYGLNLGNTNSQRVGTTYKLYQFDRLGEFNHIYDGATMNGEVNVKNDNRLSYINENSKSYQLNFSLNYARTFGDHDISGLFSIEKSEAESNRQDVSKDDPILQNNGQFNSAFGEIGGDARAYESGALSYIGRLNYAYKDKYLAEFLFRTDASTKFAPENYWGRFYSGSVGWVLSQGDFFSVKWVDFLKIRYAFGLLGKDDTQAWLWRQRYTTQNGQGAVFGGNNENTIGMKLEKSPNRDATWSDEFKNNIGIDARFLDNRLSANIEGFYNKSTNMLMEPTGNIPVTVGGSIASVNFGAMDSYGIEIGAGWSDQTGNDFNYGIDLRFNWYDDKVKIGNFNDVDLLKPWMPKPGQSSDYGMWGHDYLGMFKTQADIDAYVSEYGITQVFGTNAADLKPGMFYYRDIRGQLQPDGTYSGPDGIIDENDQIKLANKQSSHYGFGTTLRASYKSLSFSCVISGSWGGWSEIDGASRKKLNNQISRVFESRPVFWGDIYDPVLNPTGVYPNPNWENISLAPTSEFWRVSSFRMQMRSFNVNYNLPRQLADAIKVSNARIFVSAMNPITFYNPFDFKDADLAYDSYPNLRTYSLGLNITF